MLIGLVSSYALWNKSLTEHLKGGRESLLNDQQVPINVQEKKFFWLLLQVTMATDWERRAPQTLKVNTRAPEAQNGVL